MDLKKTHTHFALQLKFEGRILAGYTLLSLYWDICSYMRWYCSNLGRTSRYRSTNSVTFIRCLGISVTYHKNKKTDQFGWLFYRFFYIEITSFCFDEPDGRYNETKKNHSTSILLTDVRKPNMVSEKKKHFRPQVSPYYERRSDMETKLPTNKVHKVNRTMK